MCVQYIGVFNINWKAFLTLLPQMHHDIPLMYRTHKWHYAGWWTKQRKRDVELHPSNLVLFSKVILPSRWFLIWGNRNLGMIFTFANYYNPWLNVKCLHSSIELQSIEIILVLKLKTWNVSDAFVCHEDYNMLPSGCDQTISCIYTGKLESLKISDLIKFQYPVW